LLLFTRIKKSAIHFFAGYSGKMKSGVITKGGGNIISEIDGKPAQLMFREWAEGYYDNIDVSKGDQIVMSSVINPLAKAFKMPDGSLKYITIHAFKFHQNGKDMTVALTINEGERIYYVEGSRSSVTHSSHALKEMSSDFEKIIESATVMGEKTSAITTACREQLRGIEQVSSVTNMTDKICQQVAVDLQKSASASEEMHAKADQMRRFVDELIILIEG